MAELTARSMRAFARGAKLLWGQDFEIGRRLPELFRLAGLLEVRALPRFWVDLTSDFQAESAESRRAHYRWQLERMEKQEDVTDSEALRRFRRWEEARLAGGMTAGELADYRERQRRRLRAIIDDPERLASDVAVRTWGGVIARGQRA